MSGKVKMYTRRQRHRARMLAQDSTRDDGKVDKARLRELEQQEAEMERVMRGCSDGL